MPKYPRLTAKEAERLLLRSGFVLDRQKGSHKIYVKCGYRMVLPPCRRNIAPQNHQTTF